MSKALVLIAPGFEEVEFCVPVDILRRGEVEVTIASILDEKCCVKSRNGIMVEPECLVSDIPSDQLFDLIFVPGGLPCAEAFVDSKQFGEIYKKHNNANKYIAAICASPMALNAHGINHGKKITSYPAVQSKLEDNYQYCSDAVVVDGNMITSRGPGTAFEYGFTLLGLLKGEAMKTKIASGMLCSL